MLSTEHNGVSILWLHKEPTTDAVVTNRCMPQRLWRYMWITVLQGTVPKTDVENQHSSARDVGSHGGPQDMGAATQRKILLDTCG